MYEQEAQRPHISLALKYPQSLLDQLDISYKTYPNNLVKKILFKNHKQEIIEIVRCKSFPKLENSLILISFSEFVIIHKKTHLVYAILSNVYILYLMDLLTLLELFNKHWKIYRNHLFIYKLFQSVRNTCAIQ